MAVDPDRLDPVRVRRAFERAASTYDAAAVLQREVGQRMAERLDFIKLAPATILDAGCGTGDALGELRARHPRALLVGLDLALNMALAAKRRATSQRRLLSRLLRPLASFDAGAPRLVCGDVCRLPLRSGVVDLVWSNLTLQWVNDLSVAFAEIHRALAVDGLFVFSTFGPDTLQELRSAFRGVDGATHTHRFIDMHDVGDLLVHAGFADPVMDMERITLTYADAMTMMRELKAIGAHNATEGRRRGLTGKAGWARMLAALECFREGGRLPATFEIVYGHAWKPQPKTTPEGHAIVRFRSRDAQ